MQTPEDGLGRQLRHQRDLAVSRIVGQYRIALDRGRQHIRRMLPLGFDRFPTLIHHLELWDAANILNKELQDAVLGRLLRIGRPSEIFHHALAINGWLHLLVGEGLAAHTQGIPVPGVVISTRKDPSENHLIVREWSGRI